MYMRPEIAHQIVTVPVSDVCARMELRETDARYIYPETLVAVCRAEHAAGRTDVAQEIAGVLLVRIGRMAGGMVNRYRLGNAAAEDVVADVQERALMALLDPTQEFFGVNVGVWAKRATQNALYPAQREQGRKVELLNGDGDDLADMVAFISPDIADSLITDLTIREALAALDPKAREAVLLAHVAGYQTDSKDEDAQTVARMMGVSGRSVRTYLRRGEGALREVLAA